MRHRLFFFSRWIGRFSATRPPHGSDAAFDPDDPDLLLPAVPLRHRIRLATPKSVALFFGSLTVSAHWRALWVLAFTQLFALSRPAKAWIIGVCGALFMAALFSATNACPVFEARLKPAQASVDLFLLGQARSMSEASTNALARRWSAGEPPIPESDIQVVSPADPAVHWPRGTPMPASALGPSANGRPSPAATASAAAPGKDADDASNGPDRTDPSQDAAALPPRAAAGPLDMDVEKAQPQGDKASLFAPKQIAIQGPVPAEVIAFFRSKGVGLPFLDAKGNMEDFMKTPEGPKLGLIARDAPGVQGGIGMELWISRSAQRSVSTRWTIRALKMYQREQVLRKLDAKGISLTDLAATPIVSRLSTTPDADEAERARWSKAWAKDAEERLFVSLWLELGVFFGSTVGVVWLTRQRAGELAHWAQTPYPAWVIAGSFPLAAGLGSLVVGIPALILGDLILAFFRQPVHLGAFFWLPLALAGSAMLSGMAQVLIYSVFRTPFLQRFIGFPLSLLIVLAPMRAALLDGAAPSPEVYDAANVAPMTLANTARPWHLMAAVASGAPWEIKLMALALSVAIFFALFALAHRVIGRFERFSLQQHGKH